MTRDEQLLAFAAQLDGLALVALTDGDDLFSILAGAALALRVITGDRDAIATLADVTCRFGGVDPDTGLDPAAPVVQISNRRPR